PYVAGVVIRTVCSGRVGGVRWQGLAVRNAIMLYGVFSAGFGVVLLLTGTHEDGAPLNMVALVSACILLAAAGGSDNVSAVFRSTILQAASPDSMRGRTQGIFIVVV